MRNPGVFRGAFIFLFFIGLFALARSYVSVELADTGRYRLVSH